MNLNFKGYKRVARSLALIMICDNLVVVLCTTSPTDASLQFLETTTFIHIFAIVNGGSGVGGGWTFFSKEEGGYFTHIFVVTVTSFKMTSVVFYNEERGNKFPAGLLLDICSSVLCWRVTLNRMKKVIWSRIYIGNSGHEAILHLAT